MFCFSLGLKYRHSNHRSSWPAALCLVVPLMALLSLPRTVLAFRYLWLSRFLRLNQPVPAQISHRRLVCQACVPLSPLCLPYSPFVSSSVSLLLPAAAAWLGFLFCSTAESSWVLLFWKRVATKDFVKRLRGSVSQNLISDLVRTSFAPRSDLVKIAASQNPARRGFGKALQWSAAWSAAAAAVVACAAASGQGAVFGQRTKRFVKGLEAVRKKPKA